MTPEYINAHEPIYNYLLRYFLPELSDPLFLQDTAKEIEQDERMTYCRYMAAWLPYQPHYDQILQSLCDMAMRQPEAQSSAYYTSKQICTA